jgi:RluA family pseudouridine synthase
MTNSALPPVLFEDDSFIAFDKPSGLLVAPDRWDKERENLADLIHKHLSPNFFNVHRLDRDTSGVILVAKTKKALDAASNLFHSREVQKRYVAITHGLPKEEKGTIRMAMAEDEERPGKMKIVRSGKPAVTDFEVAERFRRYALVTMVPHTGRTHQLRVHLAAIGCPITCDRFYGDGRGLMLSELKRHYKQHKDRPERPLIDRLALHAEALSLPHPVTGEPLILRAPLPDDFELALKYLRRYSGGAAGQPAEDAAPES